ncbi:hypothetical protein [Streptomyces sp. NPDC048825]|uniref:hypothetical protein n=1 Tax=Streptomyces sp. NPDC048825 TaxID=3365592 RepID=UPI0037242003
MEKHPVGYDIYIQTPNGRLAEGEENYFRFELVPRLRALDTMSHFGMLTDLPYPSIPLPSAYGLTEMDLEPGVKHDLNITNRIAEYTSVYRAVMDAAEPEPTGIPKYKLAYNDGSLVTVTEITAALSAYEAHPSVAIAEVPIGDPTWRHWIAFLRRAKDHGGLRAY